MQLETFHIENKEPPFIVLDNVVHPKDADHIENAFMDSQFSWHYNDVTAEPGEIQSEIVKDTPQFTHTLIDNINNAGSPISIYAGVAELVINSIKENTQTPIVGIERVKANLLLPQINWNRSWCNMPHVDKNDNTNNKCNFVSAVYYVNESDGDTVFFNKWYGEEQTEDGMPPIIIGQSAPKKGRIVMFNSNRFHASCPPMNSPRRVVINMVLKVSH